MDMLAKLKYTLVSLYGVVMLGRRSDDYQYKYISLIGNAQDNLAELARVSGRMGDPFRNPLLERMWQEQYCPAPYDVDQLMTLSPSTLGGAYARHMTRRGLRPDYYDAVEARHKFHYLRLRVRQTHDIWHVLTGFDTDPVGELGLQGFYFGQVTNGLSAVLLAGGIFKCLFTGRYADLEHFISVFCEGYHNGRAAHFLLEVRWEQLWSEPLDSLRQRYGIIATGWRAPN
jgi:ubiquinone biosynthesis protein Coq4